jgi:hypothetical protein
MATPTKPETGAQTPQAQEDAKKAINKFTAPQGSSLDEHHLTRAASEYMVAMRPQPTPDQMQNVLASIVAKDDKGELKNKVQDTDAVPALVDAALK